MMMSLSMMALWSGAVSPVSSTMRLLSSPLKLRAELQSSMRSLESALSGAMYTTLEPGYTLNKRSMASSDTTVLPEPVGAPNNTFSSVWYSVWKICVWIGLKNLNLCS